VDAGARRVGVYAETPARWPAGWRAVPREAQGPEGPYREAERWEQVVQAGIPRATSLFVAPVLVVALMWSVATMLALGDGLEVLRGARPLGPALASFFLCVTRAGIGIAVLGAAVGRVTAHFAAWSAVALGLDLLLYTVPIPCSDHRSDDVGMAAFGLVAGLLLAGGFAWSALRRRGLVARDPERLARMN
jgi:hypothetical protein